VKKGESGRERWGELWRVFLKVRAPVLRTVSTCACTQAAALPSIGPLIMSNNLDAKSNGHGSSPLEMMLQKLIIICFLYILIVLGQTLQSPASSINLECKLYKGRMEPVYKRSTRSKKSFNKPILQSRTYWDKTGANCYDPYAYRR
jgi:hypothetical protein